MLATVSWFLFLKQTLLKMSSNIYLVIHLFKNLRKNCRVLDTFWRKQMSDA